jgi:hypothetical protein
VVVGPCNDGDWCPSRWGEREGYLGVGVVGVGRVDVGVQVHAVRTDFDEAGRGG